MGISAKLPNVPALTLGVADISLLEMVQAYATIANRGVWTEPVFLKCIISSTGDTLFLAPETKTERAMSQQTSALLIDMMKNVVNAGTASRLRGTYGLGISLAGKTGTTQNNTDGWFIGFTPKLVTGAWVGGEDPSVRFRSTSLGQGASMALPICGKFLRQVTDNPETKKYSTGGFITLPDSVMAFYDCPMWKPDNFLLDTNNFFGRIYSAIKSKLKNNESDSVPEMQYPGSEED